MGIALCVFCCALPALGKDPTLTDEDLLELMRRLREAPTSRPAGLTLQQPAETPPTVSWPVQQPLYIRTPAEWPRTMPPLVGSILIWLEAEFEAERRVNDGAFLSENLVLLAHLRDLALEHPGSAAAVWAKLITHHPAYTVRDHAFKVIMEPRNVELRTPAVRQIVFDAGIDSPSPIFSREVERNLFRFGKNQLQPLTDAEFVRQLHLVMRGLYCLESDDIFSLYLHEVMRRKLRDTGQALEVDPLVLLSHRRLMIRTVKNRLQGLPDPLTFKVARNENDARLVEIELSLTDRGWTTYDLQPYSQVPFRILVELQFPDGTSKVWMEKYPDRIQLQPGQPIRTVVSTALIRKAHTVHVSLPQFPYPSASKYTPWVEDGPLLLFSANVDMPALP